MQEYAFNLLSFRKAMNCQESPVLGPGSFLCYARNSEVQL